MSTRRGTSSDWQELLLGDYEINSPLEWEHLVWVLIFLQLRAVMELLADMKNMGSKVLRETQTASLAQAEIRIGEPQVIDWYGLFALRKTPTNSIGLLASTKE